MTPLRQADIDSFFNRGSSRTPGNSLPPSSQHTPPQRTLNDDSDSDGIVVLGATVQSAAKAQRPRSTAGQVGAPPSSGSTSRFQQSTANSWRTTGGRNVAEDTDEEQSSGDDIRNIRLSPTQRQPWRPTTRRIISDEDDTDREPQPANVGARKKAHRLSDASDTPPAKRTRGRTTRQRLATHDSESDSGADGRSNTGSESASHQSPSQPGRVRKPQETPVQRRIRRLRAGRHHQPISSSEVETSDSDAFVVSDNQSPRGRRSRSRASGRQRQATDPDEESDAGAETEPEDDATHDLELDEPERFATETRLRQRRETAQQRLLRKLKNKRLGIVSSGSDDDDAVDDQEEEDAEATRDDSAGFITDDDDEFDQNLMPTQFSLGYAQSKEYKFKVMFQYLLLLVIHGPEVLPLRGDQKEYMQPVSELREHMKGIRNLRVRSQIWRANFVRALETYPCFVVSYNHGSFALSWLTTKVSSLDEMATYCNACNRRNQHCWQCANVVGRPYNPESHEALEAERGGADSDDGSDDGERLPKYFEMGQFTPSCASADRRATLSRLGPALSQPVSLGALAVLARERALPGTPSCQASGTAQRQ